jgi:hypothetical protein
MVGVICKEYMSGLWQKHGKGGERSKTVMEILMAVLLDLSVKKTRERARIRQPVPFFAIAHAEK